MAEVAILERATCYPVLPLQEISQIHICATILSNNELMSLILKCAVKKGGRQFSIRNEKAYKIIEARAKKLFAATHLPSRLRKMILEWLWPMTFKIIRWKCVYASTINNNFLQYFYWTNEGKIDSKRTGKSILKNRMISITKRFILACNLCLSNEIYEIWEDMPIDNKRDFQDDQTTICRLGLFWANKLAERNDVVSRIFDSALLHAVDIGSLEAVKHIFTLIPESEKSDKAVLCSTKLVEKLDPVPYFKEDDSVICYYILSQMTETSLIVFSNSHSLAVLSLLLYSPGQKEFLDLLKYKLDAISENCISKLLYVISCKVYLDIFKDYDYTQLFVSVWQLLEDPCKKHLRGCFLLNFSFCVLISDYFRFLLNKEPSKRAQRTSFSERLIRLNKDKWTLVLFLIENEIVTPVSLENSRSNLFSLLRVRKSNKFAWRRLIKFVRDKKD